MRPELTRIAGMTWTLRTRVFFSLSALLLVFCVWVYVAQPDSWASVTNWPVWTWAFPGIVLAWCGFSRKHPRASVMMGIAWVAYVAIMAEEPRSLIRGLLPAPASSGRKITVVSINCAVGTVEAALESQRFRPDVVLLQESPDRKEVQQIAAKLFGQSGSFAYGLDCSIVSRTKLETVDWGWSATAGQPAKTRIGKTQMLVVSARLAPLAFQEDFWTPATRRTYKSGRRLHREQIAAISAQLRKLSAGTPIIIGGDFNSPASAGFFRLWDDLLTDSFRKAGRGWGNTFLNEVPALRIDQIWVSSQINPLSVRAWRTKHSDHRMVVGEFDLAQ